MIRHIKIIPAAAFAVVLGVIGTLSCSLWNGSDENRIYISGNIEFTQIHIAFKSSGKLIDFPIEEGDEVRQGMVLARLDMQQQEEQRARELASLSVAETSLVQHLTGIEYFKASLEADILARAAQLRQAQAQLDQLLAGSRSQEKEQADAAVRQARSQFALAREEWQRAQVLYKNDDISTSQYDRYKSQFTGSQAALQQAEQHLSLVREGPRKEDIEAARAAVEQARAALQQAEASRLEVRRREQEADTRRAQIEQARAQVAYMDSVIADGFVEAPIDGIILEKSAEIGEVVAAGTTIASLGDIQRPWLRGYIRQQDHGRVKLGMKVRITTDSYPDKIYEGRLSYIASEAEFTPKQIQTPEERVKLVYRIKIEVDNPRQELKLNMPASAEIMLDED
ncbi:MAG: HlyD family efflux transporter periplasmic adaptor subunit [Acidobacteria bacterium]|nr:HlyD family efflux transporter periplasmic adaptor subunit [Acidobacteriota bacterium]